MITSMQGFIDHFIAKDGELANSANIGRAPLQLKLEQDISKEVIDALMGIVIDWNETSTYTIGQVRRHNGVVYISLQDSNTNFMPSTNIGTFWNVQPALTNGVNSTSTINGGSASAVGNTILIRKDISTNWNTINPVLRSGEFGFELDTGFIKIGDGTSDWSLLTYVSVPSQPSATVDSTTTLTTGTYYPLLFNAETGILASAGTNATLTYIPSTGEFNATQFNSTSDKIFKENIITVENSTEVIKKLNGVTFSWKETGLLSAGVIAQELEEVLPALVSSNENGIKSVNYNGIIAYLIESIKQLETRITDLEGK